MAAATTIPTRWSAAATASSRSMSTCRAARRPPKPWSTAFCSCRRRSDVPARLPADDGSMAMTQVLKELGDYIGARNPSHVVKSELVVGELILWTRPESLIPLLTFLRDDERCL